MLHTGDPFALDARRRLFMLDPRALARSTFGFDAFESSGIDRMRNDMFRTFFDMPMQFDSELAQRMPSSIGERSVPIPNQNRGSTRVYHVPIRSATSRDGHEEEEEDEHDRVKIEEVDEDKLRKQEEEMMEAAIKASLAEQHRQEKGKDKLRDDEEVDEVEDDEAVGMEVAESETENKVIPQNEEYEERLIERAIAESLKEQERVQREALKSEQDREYEASLAIDMEKDEEEYQRLRNLETRWKMKEIMKRKGQFLKSEPKDSVESGIAEIVVRLPNGKRIRRRFSKNDLVLDVRDWIEFEIGKEENDLDLLPDEIELILEFPRRKLDDDLGRSLDDAGLAPRSLIVVNSVQKM